MLIAHRGMVYNDIKENTIESFQAAIDSSKYVGFELDIRETKDLEIVVHHDLLFKGKPINKYSFKELKKYNIPRLEEVLKLDTNKIIMIEIKDFNLDLKKLAKILNKHNNKNIYVSSFNNKILKKIKPYLTNAKVGSLNYVLNSEEDYSDFDFICIINYVFTDNLKKYFKSQNKEIFVYGNKNKSKLIYSDVYYIIDENLFEKN